MLKGIREDEDAVRSLLPLVQGTLENISRVGLPQALTGPIARGDSATVERHLAALRERVPTLVPVYAAAGRHAAEVAREKGEADPAGLARIERTLADARSEPLS